LRYPSRANFIIFLQNNFYRYAPSLNCLPTRLSIVMSPSHVPSPASALLSAALPITTATAQNVLNPRHSSTVNALLSPINTTPQIVLPTGFREGVRGGDLYHEINSTGRVDGFEFIGFLSGCFETCGGLFED
jgi:hypothetical protein